MPIAAAIELEILSAGSFRESLFLIGRGTIEDPIIVQFAPGTYNFYPENAVKENGKLRIEGRDYLVQDGDIIHFRFNV